MTTHRSRRWFQLSLKSLFLLTLLVATFFAGYSLATKQAEAERQRAELEGQRAAEEARLQAEAQALQAQLAQPQAWSSSGVTWQVCPSNRHRSPGPCNRSNGLSNRNGPNNPNSGVLEDLTGNHPDATRENARREGVADRVELHTADMRQLPFPDESFDAVVSHWAVHNLYQKEQRAQALREMARVLKPSGYVVLADIQHGAEYANQFAQDGLTDVRSITTWRSAVLGAITFGNFRPAIVVARKGDALVA